MMTLLRANEALNVEEMSDLKELSSSSSPPSSNLPSPQLSFLCIYALEEMSHRITQLMTDSNHAEEDKEQRRREAVETLLKVYMEAMQQLDMQWTDTLLKILKRSFQAIISSAQHGSSRNKEEPRIGEGTVKPEHKDHDGRDDTIRSPRQRVLTIQHQVNGLLAVIEQQLGNGFDLNRRERCMQWLLDTRKELFTASRETKPGYHRVSEPRSKI